MQNDIRAEDYEEITEEQPKEQSVQEILNELEQEEKADKERVKWAEEKYYNNTHPTNTIKKPKNPKFKHSKPQKQHTRREHGKMQT